MPLSPKTEQMMAMPGADQEQEIFEQSFSEMAQSMLMNKLPELAADVATFKIIDSDLDSGSAVGAFIVQRPSNSIYVPVVLVENQLKPLEIMYSQEHDVFLPLSPEWLTEIERGALEPLGEATKTPETLYTDVDIRNLIVPPTTGRYSFASAQDLKLPDFLAAQPNSVKEKFAALLEDDKSLLKVAVAIYGSKDLIEALQLRAEKTAADKAETSTEALAIATKKTPAQEVKSVFGPQAPEAMQDIAKKGFAAKDSRKNLNKPVDEEGSIKLQQVTAAGAYKLYKKDGSTVTAYVMPRPYKAHGEFVFDDHAGPSRTQENTRKLRSEGGYNPDSYGYRDDYGVLTSEGKFYSVKSDLFGEPIPLGEVTGAVATAIKGEAAPKSGKGVFVRNHGGRVEFTEPFEITSVSTGADGVKRCKAKQGYDFVTIVINTDGKHAKVITPKDSGLVVIPGDFKWVPAKARDTSYPRSLEDDESEWESPFLKDPSRLGMSYMNLLKLDGGKSVSVKKASYDDYVIGRTNFSGSRVDTIIKIAQDYRISVADAETVVKLADERGLAKVVVASRESLLKLAEGDDKKKSPTKKKTVTEEPVADPNAGGAAPPPGAEGDPGADPGMDPGMDPNADPSMQGMDPNDPNAQAAMDPSMAAPPSPTDQAVAELQEEVTRAHEEQMKLLQHKIDALQMVANRTQEIVQGVPKEQSQAIQQAVSTAASGQPQAGAPAPAGVQGAPGGEDAPAGAPPMDPNAPMDPSLMQQAAGMNDPSMFDASAIGTLAEHSSVKDLVSNYMPTLEKSIDHIGRILLTLWMKGSELRPQMGEQNYTQLEDKLRNIFKGLGSVVLRLNRDSLIIGEGESQEDDATAGL